MLGILKRLSLLLLLCCFYSNVSAQQYGYVQYNNDSGAPLKKVNTVLQDNEGYIWIGSQNGLYRFDGINFDIYSIQTESQSIHQLKTVENIIYFINDKGLYKIENLNNQPSLSKLLEGTINESDDKPFYPNDFIISKDQTIWISQSNHSVGRWKDGEFKTFHFSKSTKEQNLIIQEDTEGNIWVISQLDGLFRFNKASNTFVKQLEIKNGTAFLINKDHLVIGNQELKIYSISGNSPRLLKTFPLVNDYVTAIHPDQNDQYYIGTEKGNLFKIKDIESPPQTIYGANEAHRVEKLDFQAGFFR